MSNPLGVACFVLAITACGGQTTLTSGDGGTTGTTGAAIGDPCVPTLERDPKYLGASEREVSIETRSPQCASGVCLMNHFRGRITCPYGQDSTGAAPPGAQACTTGDGGLVTGNGDKHQATVAAQCTDRRAANVVTCSCRCANAAGKTDDGQAYCACGAGMVCTQLVTSIGAIDDDVSGAYCIKSGTADDPACDCQSACDPALHDCP